ncbi:MAG: transposase [Thermomicrobiales bacterium]|nr:transposase [Thermomicrobiales bacterium]
MTEPPLQVLGHPLLELTDQRWWHIQALLPVDSGLGRPRHDDRAVLEAMLWVIRTGAGWNQLPTTVAPAATVRSRYRHWRENGVWATILTVLTQSPRQSPT